MKVIILGAAPLKDSAEAPPIWIAERSGEMLVQRLVRACAGLGAELIFAVRADDIKAYNLNSVIALAAPGSALVPIRGLTDGAACTALFCISHINYDDELLILNSNEIVSVDYAAVVADFRARELDAGVIVFDSLNPRYSYVRLSENNLVVEATEKNPISHHAIAGATWYKRGGDFVAAAQSMVRKDARVNGSFFISLTLNELILQNKQVGTFEIAAHQYHPLKTRRQVAEFEADLPEEVKR